MCVYAFRLCHLSDLTGVEFKGNAGVSSLDEYAHYSEHVTSPPSSSTSTKIGSATVEKPTAKRRQLEAVVVPNVDKPQRASGPRKSTGKPPAGATKAPAKTVASTSRPAKGKTVPNQKPVTKPEGSASKGPTQKLIRRVHAIVEVPIKVEDEEEEPVHDLTDDKKGRIPSDKAPKPSTALTKAARLSGPSRTKGRVSPLYMDDDITPPAPDPLPNRRKSGIDRDYYEPDEDVCGRRNQEDTNARNRPPPRMKSIRDLRESDFEYIGEESDTDELNLGV